MNKLSRRLATIFIIIVFSFMLCLFVRKLETNYYTLSRSACRVPPSASVVAALNDSACDTIAVQAGNPGPSSWYRWTRSNVTLECEIVNACKFKAVIFEGNNNTMRGFDISDPTQKAVRFYGNNNTFELNQVHDMYEDGLWIWGKGNTIRNNYFHHLWALQDENQFDQHVDGGMSWAWNPAPWVTVAEDNIIENNIFDLDRTSGSNQLFIFTADQRDGTILPKNFTFNNNIFICRDSGYCPIALYNNVPGMVITNNTVYNTTGKGASFIYSGQPAECHGNIVHGYSSMGCTGDNQLLPFTGLPVITWPPEVITQTPTVTPAPEPLCYKIILETSGLRPGPSMWYPSYSYAVKKQEFYIEELVSNIDPPDAPYPAPALFAKIGEYSYFAVIYREVNYAEPCR